MKFNQTPHPNIEDHYHIQELINAQEKRSNDRTYHREKKKERVERDADIGMSKPVTRTDFFCRKCKEDFKAISIRQIEDDWSNSYQRIAFYRAKCTKGHWCIRLITDPHRDSFWTQSVLVAKDRGNHFADLIQPHESNFNLLYGKK